MTDLRARKGCLSQKLDNESCCNIGRIRLPVIVLLGIRPVTNALYQKDTRQITHVGSSCGASALHLDRHDFMTSRFLSRG